MSQVAQHGLGPPPPNRGSEAGDVVATLGDLNVFYEARGRPLHAVRGVDLTISRGEIIALVGESGSGKSSVAMALLGLLPPSQANVTGSVSVLGVDMTTGDLAARTRIRKTGLGAVFQDPMSSLNPTMTIGRQLAEVTDTVDRAEAMLDAVGVPDARLRLKSYPHELSGGQRQRVMIAMAIARDPALVIADEPTTALDVTIQAQILTLIRRLRDEVGCAFVLVTHDLGVAAQIADRIAVCYAGRIIEVGRAGDMLARPRHPYTMALLRSRITLGSDNRRQLPTLTGEPPDPRALPPGCAFAPRCAFHQERCDEVVPPLSDAGTPSHLTACVRINEIGDALLQPPTPSLAHSLQDPASPQPENTGALRLQGVEKTFEVRGGGWRTRQQLQALRGVDLELGASECVAIVGESGCGKSTLLRVVAGLIEPDAGSVDQRVSGRAQMVFQDAGASLTPWLTIGEQIHERTVAAGVPRDERDARVALALERVGLPASIRRRKPMQLSGGQRQRVALARAIVIPPPILLCDEPTSSLDVSLAATVLNLIGELRTELGMAALFVTHDLAAARYVSDRIAVMYLGRIVEIGTAAQVAEAPAHPYTRALLSAVTTLDRKDAPTTGDLPSPLEPPGGCPYHPRCREALPECATQPQQLRAVGAGSEHCAACIHVGRGMP